MKTILDHLNSHDGRLPWILVGLGLNHLHGWCGSVELLGWGLVIWGGSLILDKLKSNTITIHPVDASRRAFFMSIA